MVLGGDGGDGGGGDGGGDGGGRRRRSAATAAAATAAAATAAAATAAAATAAAVTVAAATVAEPRRRRCAAAARAACTFSAGAARVDRRTWRRRRRRPGRRWRWRRRRRRVGERQRAVEAERAELVDDADLVGPSRVQADCQSRFSNRCGLDSVELSDFSVLGELLVLQMPQVLDQVVGHPRRRARLARAEAHADVRGWGVVQRGGSPNWGVAGSSPSGHAAHEAVRVRRRPGGTRSTAFGSRLVEALDPREAAAADAASSCRRVEARSRRGTCVVAVAVLGVAKVHVGSPPPPWSVPGARRPRYCCLS